MTESGASTMFTTLHTGLKNPQKAMLDNFTEAAVHCIVNGFM
jgi:hypothetical protein